MPIRIRNINIHQFDNGITLSGERAVLEIGSSLAYGAKGAEVIGLCDSLLAKFPIARDGLVFMEVTTNLN